METVRGMLIETLYRENVSFRDRDLKRQILGMGTLHENTLHARTARGT